VRIRYALSRVLNDIEQQARRSTGETRDAPTFALPNLNSRRIARNLLPTPRSACRSAGRGSIMPKCYPIRNLLRQSRVWNGPLSGSPGDASSEFNGLHFETTKLIPDKFYLRWVRQPPTPGSLVRPLTSHAEIRSLTRILRHASCSLPLIRRMRFARRPQNLALRSRRLEDAGDLGFV